jgi:hypothetical protein
MPYRTFGATSCQTVKHLNITLNLQIPNQPGMEYMACWQLAIFICISEYYLYSNAIASQTNRKINIIKSS